MNGESMRIARAFAAAVLPVVVAASCGDADATRVSVADASARVALAAATITGQEALLASEVVRPSYMGFDTGRYPGDAAMRAWRTGDSPYHWTGYYLKSPCHQDEGWSGKRESLTAMGYGLAVLYVGQQTWGRRPGAPHMERVKVARKVTSYVGKGKKRRKVTRTVTKTVLRRSPPPPPGATCSSDFVSGARGMREGVDAAQTTAREGFPRGTTIFLDLERMDVIPQRMREYYRSWTAAVIADGRYRPGIYAHTYNAKTIYADVRDVYNDAGITGDPPFWIAGSRAFDIDKAPTDVGHRFADVWQGWLDVVRTHNGVKLPIDISVASLANPSAATD